MVLNAHLTITKQQAHEYLEAFPAIFSLLKLTVLIVKDYNG